MLLVYIINTMQCPPWDFSIGFWYSDREPGSHHIAKIDKSHNVSIVDTLYNNRSLYIKRYK